MRAGCRPQQKFVRCGMQVKSNVQTRAGSTSTHNTMFGGAKPGGGAGASREAEIEKARLAREERAKQRCVC
jgi:hypothetical protein